MNPGTEVRPSQWRKEICDRVEEFLSETNVAIAYGSLAAGADLLIAERLLTRGVELHVVLPFSVEEFVLVSVNAAGPEWSDSFEKCLRRSSSVMVACDKGFLDDASMFCFASRIAMRHARNRAQFLCVDAIQLAVTDGRRWSNTSGTASDIENWRRAGKNRTSSA